MSNVTGLVHCPRPRHACCPPRRKVEHLTEAEASEHPDAIAVSVGPGNHTLRWREFPAEDGIHGDPWHPVGTVWECHCGAMWEVVAPRYANYFANEWAPVGRLRAWWLRKRRERRSDR